MKSKILLIVLLIRLVHSGQTFNYAHHTGNETTFNMVGINSKSFYMVRITAIGACCNDKIFLVGIDDSGNEIFRRQVGSGAYLEDAEVVATSDGHLLTMTGTIQEGCDYPGNSYNVFKIDTVGNVEWTFHSTNKIEQLIPWTDGGFYLFSNVILERYTPTGQKLSNFNSISVPGGSSISLDNNNNFLISYFAGNIPRFQVLDSMQFQIADVPAVSSLTAMMQSTSGNIYGLSGNQIHRYSSSYTFTDNSGNSVPATFSITAFTIRNDTIYATGKTVLSKSFYMILDSNFNVLHQSLSNLTNVLPTDIHINNRNWVQIITTGTTALPSSNSFSGYFRIPVNGSFNGRFDVGVTDFATIDDPYYVMCNGPCYLARLNLLVTVRNFGTDTVKEFHLNNSGKSNFAGVGQCNIGLCMLSSQVIPPGGTITLQTGPFYTGAYNSYLQPGASFSYNVCLNTSIPNAENDVNVTNDFLCRYVTFLPLDVAENAWSSNEVSLYPNPSPGEVTVTSKSGMKSIEIYDMAGKLLAYFQVNDQHSFLLRNTIEEGMYLLKVNTEKGYVMKKVVISY
jgi:hypothetical protein